MTSETIKVVLVATDGSPAGTAALRKGAEIAGLHHAKLVVVTVTRADLDYHLLRSDELREYARAERLGGGSIEAHSLMAENILAEARAILADWPELEPVLLARDGDPAETILAAAFECRADLIVLGAERRGLLGSFLFGSVARSVAGAARCPVEVVAAR